MDEFDKILAAASGKVQITCYCKRALPTGEASYPANLDSAKYVHVLAVPG